MSENRTQELFLCLPCSTQPLFFHPLLHPVEQQEGAESQVVLSRLEQWHIWDASVQHLYLLHQFSSKIDFKWLSPLPNLGMYNSFILKSLRNLILVLYIWWALFNVRFVLLLMFAKTPSIQINMSNDWWTIKRLPYTFPVCLIMVLETQVFSITVLPIRERCCDMI